MASQGRWKTMVIRDESGAPFSKWKPAKKFMHVLRSSRPDVWQACVVEHQFSTLAKYRFDFAWLEQRVAVEIDGFGYGHQAQQQMSKDNEKANLAILEGWKVLRFNSRQLGSMDGVVEAVEQTAELVVAGVRLTP